MTQPQGDNPSSVADTVRRLVEPLVTPHGIEVVDVEHGPGLLRISIDFVDPTHPIDLDTITTYSEQISDLLDLHDPLPTQSRYTLEVSSPGLERPLKTAAQFKRFVGTPVNIKTKAHATPEGQDRRFTATLTEATDTHITVTVAGDPPRTLAYTDIEKAKTVFEWGPTPKPNAKNAPQQKHRNTTKKATTS